jgi:NADPH:quinone reductase-like Zn-dependent oxidoreductase
VDHASLRAGQHILIHGAAGGVGSFAVQIAVDLGARVTATVRESDREFVTNLGAHEVLDYANERFDERFDGVDAVLDMVGGETQALLERPAARCGVLVVAG